MAKTESVTVDLPDAVAKEMREAIESGEYASSGDVFQDAMLDWSRKRWLEGPDVTARLREAALDGLASGGWEPFDMDAILAGARADHQAKTQRGS